MTTDENENKAAGGPDAPATPAVPSEVVWLLREGHSPIRAWREHLGVTREELGRRLSVVAAAVTQLEARNARPRAATLKKVAAVLGINWELLQAAKPKK
ncbi:helix-turn-helix domain-containing protein [Desulfovibrio sp. TomC]|uniref:helix-turn-helix domain-containing protein n=1 Tax=Desulfovibrio sp. TomC TaxID=1562888 RepID=UPI000574D269|nr:helix-turn-helix transcriptional regulator [Desulfovibrio sp. TomC]KHK02991.1 transcriptional regulator, XRE-family [Desulfovibrio sp. TomC]